MLIVGLGNPGKEYELTRHNVGFRAIDHFLEKHNFVSKGTKGKAELFQGAIRSKPIRVAKPQTFMNLSGESVLKLSQFFKIPVSEILVVYDDFDLPFGTVKLRAKGGPGTHNGMKSIVQLLGSNTFPRLRIGIGPLPPKWDVANFVLSNFMPEEERALNEILDKTSAAILASCENPIEKAMNLVN